MIYSRRKLTSATQPGLSEVSPEGLFIMPLIAEYRCDDPNDFQLTAEMIRDYNEYGYILVRNLLTQDEVEKVKKTFEMNEDVFMKYSFQLNDGGGGKIRSCNWNLPGNDPSGILARIEKVAKTSEQLMGGKEIFHYHSKLVMKEPYTGGQFQWHQDYGYWYNNGNLFPDLITAYFAIDKATKENGCLQVLRGSHKCGRIDHPTIGGQKACDKERVQEIIKYGLENVYVEIEPGDCLFFHCNIIHKSGNNNSPNRRWALTISYNTRENESEIKHHHAQYSPLDIVPNRALMECTAMTDLSGKAWMDPHVDKTIVVDDSKERSN